MSLDLVKLNPRLRILTLFLLMALKQGALYGQDESASVVSDLRYGWMIIEEGEFRIIQSDKIRRKAIHFYLDQESVGSQLFVKVPEGSSIWIDRSLLEFFEKDTILIFSSNQLLDGRRERLISIYGEDLNSTTLETKLINPSYAQSLTPIIRKNTGLRDFYLISFFVGLLLTVFFKMSSSGNIQEYFMVGRTFSVRSRDEVIFKSKLLTAPNPIFYFVISFLASQLLIILFLLAPESFSRAISVRVMNTGGLLLLQGIILLVFYIWILLKWIIVRYLGGLFRISEFSPIHFFNYQRISLYILLLLTTVLFAVYFGIGSHFESYSFFIGIILIVTAFRMVLILVKLLNASSYKFLHLFSYLCATEIIPYLFAIKLILI